MIACLKSLRMTSPLLISLHQTTSGPDSLAAIEVYLLAGCRSALGVFSRDRRLVFALNRDSEVCLDSYSDLAAAYIEHRDRHFIADQKRLSNPPL